MDLESEPLRDNDSCPRKQAVGLFVLFYTRFLRERHTRSNYLSDSVPKILKMWEIQNQKGIVCLGDTQI